MLEGNEDIEGPEDLAGKPVCSVEGSTPAANIVDDTAPTLDARPTPTPNCLEPLRTGRSSRVTTDNVILAGLADQNAGEFKVVGDPFTEEPYGIGLAKDDTDFRDVDQRRARGVVRGRHLGEAWEETAGAVLDVPEPPAVDRY